MTRRTSIGIAVAGAAVVVVVWLSKTDRREPRDETAPIEEPAAPSIEPPTTTPPPVAIDAPEEVNIEEPMIDIPADPPPPDAGTDRSRSGLPPALFDKHVALQAQGPTPERLSAVRRRHPISEQAIERVRLSFRKHDEEAALAIGHFRLGSLDEAEALAAIGRAHEAYRRETMAALELSNRDFAAIFEAD